MIEKIREKLKNILKEKDDSYEFKSGIAEIEDEPVNPIGRTIFWTLMCLILFTGLWLFFGKADIVVTARGKIIPDGEIKIMQPLETGVIKRILVKEGDFVKQGQTLMEIDTATTEPQLESLKANLDYINLERKRLRGEKVSDSRIEAETQNELYKSSYADLQNQIMMKNAEIRRLSTEISNYQSQLRINQDKERRMLEVSDILAKNDLEKVKAENIDYRNRISSLMHQRREVQKELDYVKSNFKTQNLTELASRDKQANELDAEIKKIEFRKQQQNIISPVDGYVNTMMVHTVGGVVTPAEKIISVVPANAPLVVKVNVLNKDIGFIREGMSVLIKIDTFDFQKYGIVKGTVKKIAKDSIEDEKEGPIYDVYISLLNKTLMVEGKETPITTGMSLSAEIKVGKRRIIEFFIYPMIKYWNQAITVR